MNSAFFVGKRRNRYGWLIPARRATSSVEVPASPCAANSTTAASRTISRRSAAGIRCFVSVTTTKLVMTHYFVNPDDQTRQLTLNGDPGDGCVVVCGGAPCPTIVPAEFVQERSRSAQSEEVSPIFVHR